MRQSPRTASYREYLIESLKDANEAEAFLDALEDESEEVRERGFAAIREARGLPQSDVTEETFGR